MRQHELHGLRTALRDEAELHRPDREAMLNRLAQGRAAPTPSPLDRLLVLLRPVAAAVAVAVVLVLAVAGVRLSHRGPEVDDTPAAPATLAPTTPVPATTTPAPQPPPPDPVTTPPRPQRTATGTSAPASPAPATTTTTGPGADTDRDGYLRSAGAVDPNTNDNWSQQSVQVTTTRTLTALDVSVDVVLTPELADPRWWSTVPPARLTVTTSRTATDLTFRFTLQPGVTLAPGSYTFAVQFTHRKRSADGDSYRVKVTGDDKDAKVSGGFTRSG